MVMILGLRVSASSSISVGHRKQKASPVVMFGHLPTDFISITRFDNQDATSVTEMAKEINQLIYNLTRNRSK